VHRDGKAIPAVVVSTKMGHIFVLDRDTGKPLFPVEERAVPQSDVPGEETSPTQPFHVLPKPVVPEHLSAGEAWGLTASDRAWCRATIASLRNEGIFTPPSLRGTLAVPGNIGGSNWGGVSVDRAHGLLILPTNRIPAVVRLIPRDRYAAERDSIHEGEFAPMHGTPYAMWREFLLSPSRLPCSPPPWGTLTAIDLATGAVKWEVPLGEFPWAPKGSHLEHDGTINLGGSVVTAGGLVFIGATLDPHFRAFDAETGKLLWTADLPMAATATPMTFRAPNGKQYVVIAAGGHARTGLPIGDYLIAYALP
jgi:quinoprotein glucose dehydrogenase